MEFSKKILFLFSKKQDFVKENRKSFGILQDIFIYLFIYFPDIRIFKIK